MARVRSLLARVRRIERGHSDPSPFVRAYGSLEAFEAETLAGVEAGRFDREMLLVLAAIRRWHEEELWKTWS